ncbi:hypothetical protein T492DRAFT_875819 [Pavlovales sp. CCMP2436]|nr:hypothetical protein T492DRAFT_875819 [Pavlovales sp. CCMP2436]
MQPILLELLALFAVSKGAPIGLDDENPHARQLEGTDNVSCYQPRARKCVIAGPNGKDAERRVNRSYSELAGYFWQWAAKFPAGSGVFDSTDPNFDCSANFDYLNKNYYLLNDRRVEGGRVYG